MHTRKKGINLFHALTYFFNNMVDAYVNFLYRKLISKNKNFALHVLQNFAQQIKWLILYLKFDGSPELFFSYLWSIKKIDIY